MFIIIIKYDTELCTQNSGRWHLLTIGIPSQLQYPSQQLKSIPEGKHYKSSVLML